MHEGQLEISDDLVHDLVVYQFPRLSDLQLHRVPSDGTVHAIYRLGSELAVRLPLLEEFSPALIRETQLLELLAPQLPLPIPELVGLGEPTVRYPASWSIVTWIEGRTLAEHTDFDLAGVAASLGEFVAAMRSARGPGEISPNQRGRPLESRREGTIQAIAEIADEFDSVALHQIWDAACSAEKWDEVRTWIHGDLLPGNLITVADELSAVIDFGECSIGNPTHDLIAGWWVFTASTRSIFKDAAGADDDAWSRARGMALSGAAGALAYYRETNPGFSAVARRTLREVVADARGLAL
ncbi:MAG: aminoglycoside phosphotransferase family protein [Acidimicrobiia bacterium]|nr:aminoglycoside phosphotransferase family protein [Acidimicrobiia bacterium]